MEGMIQHSVLLVTHTVTNSAVNMEEDLCCVIMHRNGHKNNKTDDVIVYLEYK